MITDQENQRRRELQREWKDFGELESIQKAEHPNLRRYLENRVDNAFRAGMDAGRRAYIESLPPLLPDFSKGRKP